MKNPERYTNYNDFFPFYLREHRKQSTRVFHYFGTIAYQVLFWTLIATQNFLFIPLILLAGYGPAWVSHFFIEKNKPDAIISADIICGVISINIARSLGIKIPEELSVVGFGDKTISEYSSPKLTTIYQHGSEIGNRSVELLVDRMNSKWFGLEKNTNSFTTEIIPTMTIGGGSK